MRAQRGCRPMFGIALCGTALLLSACFGGGQQAQPTATAAATTAASPVASPPVVPKPSPFASPAASPSPRTASGPEQTYTVETGDTLATIAQKFYGDPTLWRQIYEANRSAIGDNPDAIRVGMELKIPPKE